MLYIRKHFQESDLDILKNDLDIPLKDDSLTEQEIKVSSELKSIYKESTKLVLEVVKLPWVENDQINNKANLIEEMLTQKLEKLDALDYCDMEYLRSTRKQLIDLINHSLNTLDSKRSLKSDSKSPVDGLTNQNKELNKDISDPPKQTSEKVKKIKFDETEESDIDSDSRDEVDSRFSKQTISSVLGCEIPDSDFFSKDINSTAQFELKMGVFDALYKERKDRCFKKGTWQKYFVDGLKQSNPYCVFSFQHHQISIAEKRKRKSGSKTFYANAECAFKKTCPVKVNIEMFDKTTVYVKYTGNVKHQLNEIHARHVSGEEREQLKEQFKGGIKPLTKYLDAMDKTSAEVRVSGNVDGIGKK